MHFWRPFSHRPSLVIICLLALTSSASAVTSTTLRSNQYAYALGEVGSAVVPVPTAGFTLGANILSNVAAEFTYAEGDRDVDYAKLYAKLYSFKLKAYLGNSFYANAGLGYRVVSDETTDKASKMIKVERKGRSIGIDTSIGNRWQFGALSVGCDWIGFFHPLQNTRTEHFQFTGLRGSHLNHGSGSDHSGGHRPQGGKTFDRHQTDWDRLSKHGTLQLLRLSLGYAF